MHAMRSCLHWKNLIVIRDNTTHRSLSNVDCASYVSSQRSSTDRTWQLIKTIPDRLPVDSVKEICCNQQTGAGMAASYV